MRTTCWKYLFVLALPAVSCSEPGEPAGPAQAKTIRVEVGTGPRLDIVSRTALENDGRSVRWAAGDKLALWAVDAAGTAQLAAHEFVLWHYNDEYDDAKFTAQIAEMPEGAYTYCAVSPVPDAVAGTRASFDIPSVQDGTFRGAHDIMVAAPVAGGALQPGDNSGAVTLAFTHKMHLLRIEIPVNKMNLPITRLTLAFPVDVTGRLTVDAADPEAAPELTGGDNVLTLSFAEPKDAGDVVYAMIAPTALTAADDVVIKAYTDSKESFPAVMHGKDYQAGHTTPIRLTIPEMYRVTRIFFSLAGRGGATDLAEDLADGYGCSTLGEPVRSFTLTGPAGVDLGNGTNTRTFAVNEENLYEIFYEGEFTQHLAGDYTVAFDSDNALVSGTFRMNQPTADISNDPVSLSVPYLLEENFSGAGGFSGPELTGNVAGNELSGSGLPGWYAGARSTGIAGKCVNLQSYSNIGGPYHSRLDSRPLGGIKSGKTVSVRIVFNADWKKNVSATMELIVGRTSGHNLDSGIDNSTYISMSSNSSASENYIPTQRNVTVANFTGAQSIAWKTNGKNGKWNQMFKYEDLYIDNIKVSIVR